MKKSILGLSLLTVALFASETTTGLDMLVSDAKTINTTAMSSLDSISKSQTKLDNYEKKVNNYSDAVAKFSQQQAQSFSSKKEALQAMNSLKELSSQSVVMAKEITYLSAHQADNASDDYKTTLKTLSKTTLRLSDDIGKMSDRILVMADKIGVMADRIVETQKIQSRNLQATTTLVNGAMQLAAAQTNGHQAMTNKPTSNMTNMQNSVMKNSAMQNNAMKQTSQMQSSATQQTSKMQNMGSMPR